jgi:hypothetical protein
VRQYGLSPSELQRATAAIDRYNTRLRLGDGAGRDELLAELSAILTEEERGNFGAALARRPVVPKAGPLFMAGNGAGVTLSDNVSRQLAQTLEVLRQGK